MSLNGAVDTTQIITGTTTFNHLSATTGDRILEFGASTTFTVATDANLTFTGDHTQDGLHLTADGHRQMADHIQRWLSRWFVLADTTDYAPPSTDDMLNGDDLPHSRTTGSDQQRQGDR